MILVVAEQQQGRLNRATLETVAAAQGTGQPVRVVLLGTSVTGVARQLAAVQVEAVVTVEQDALEPYTPDGFVGALEQVVDAESPDLIFLPHTYQTRDFAPKLAARLDRALVTDCVGFQAHGEGLAFVRPMFQGKLSADVVATGPSPHVITIQIGAFRADAVKQGGGDAPIRAAAVTLEAGAIRQKPEAPFQEAKGAIDLSQAERIVAVGRGIRGEEHLELVRKLATALGAEVAASRPICDAGWLPMDRQIGSSGQTVAPKLYVALGISGAIQHVVGIKGARAIVAINKDAEAPIFEVADFGIVGDLFEVVPAMIAELGK
jgi:electron transfer flavoprotein alpha subunit